MASRRKRLIEVIDYRRFIGGDNVSNLSAVGSWEEVLLFSMDFSVPKHSVSHTTISPCRPSVLISYLA